MNKYSTSLLVVLLFTQIGCAIKTKIILPENTKIKIHGREAVSQGLIKTKPFFWTAAGGIKYELVKDGKVVRTGRLKSTFRPMSIFWPPYATIYWPIGFSKRCYDLTEKSKTDQDLGGNCS